MAASVLTLGQALQKFVLEVQSPGGDDKQQGLEETAEEPATPNDVFSYLSKLQAAGHFPRDEPWKSQWRLMTSLEIVEPTWALKALRKVFALSQEALRHGREFHPWPELCNELEELNIRKPSAPNHCLKDVREALQRAKEKNEAPDEEDLFRESDMIDLLGEVPCDQAAKLLNNFCENPDDSLLRVVHAVSYCIARHQGGMQLWP